MPVLPVLALRSIKIDGSVPRGSGSVVFPVEGDNHELQRGLRLSYLSSMRFVFTGDGTVPCGDIVMVLNRASTRYVPALRGSVLDVGLCLVRTWLWS